MISIDREMFWQWDRGQRVKLHDVTAGTEVHFSNAEIKPNALVKEAYEDGEGVYADVPDVLLQTAGTMSAYIYIEDGDEGHTEYKKLFIVRDREKPDDYVYTEDDVKTWEMLEERVKALEESGGGAAGGLIRPLSTIGEIVGVTVEHVPDKDRVDLTVEMTAENMNSVFGGNAVYKNDYLNARQLQLMFRIPGAGRLFLWELFEDDLITVTNYPNKKFIMVSTNRMIFSFTYDENGQYVSETKTYQANVQQVEEVKATVPNSATVNDVDELVMQRADGDAVSELFKVRLPERGAFKSYRYFSEIDWGTTLGSSFVVRDPYISKGDVYPAIPDGCEAPFICHTTLVRYTLTVIVCTADGRSFKAYLDLPSMKFSSVTEITQQGGGSADIPETLPNPHPLTFTGAVEATYDGSTPVEVQIPMGGGTGGEEKPWRLLDSIDFSKTENQLHIFEWWDLGGVTDIFIFNNATQNGSQTASGYTLWINGTTIANQFAPNEKSGTTYYWWARACYDGLVWIPHKSNGAIASNNTSFQNANGLFPYCVFKDIGKAEVIKLHAPTPTYQNVTGTWEIWVR